MAGDISYELPGSGEARGAAEGRVGTALARIKEAINGGLTNENLSGTAGITRANLATESKPFTWYTPKVIATEESRTNTAFGKLGTPDEIASIVLPTNGLFLFGYQATWKSSASAAGRAAFFLGSNQLQIASYVGTGPEPQEAKSPEKTPFRPLSTYGEGLKGSSIPGATEYGADVTTGQVLGLGPREGEIGTAGACVVFAAAGTYAISVQFKASSGSVTVKNRKLWVATLGY